MMVVGGVFITCMVFMTPTLARISDKITDYERVSFSTVESVAGGSAHLPCDIKPPVLSDKLLLVIWFKEENGTSVGLYSIDARRKSIEKAFHNVNGPLTGRAKFRINDFPAKLTVTNVSDSDSGVYRCRVDFRRSATRNYKVNLTVILPPEKLTVLDENEEESQSNILGPYNEGSSVNITCLSAGGRPLPRVTWWRGDIQLDDSCEVVSSSVVRNVLRLENLQRHQLHAVYTCQASNNNYTNPVSSAVSVDLNLKPLETRIQDKDAPLSAGKAYNLTCEVTGSRPSPLITWWKAGTRLFQTENSSVSVYQFMPSVSDDGKFLTCRGENPLLPDAIVEDTWLLNVYHRPEPVLEIGRHNTTTRVTEGDSVHFQCNIRAKPGVESVVWKRNGVVLDNNQRAGILMNDVSLVLEEVNKDHKGNYTCVATNKEGSSESNAVYLDVKHAPVCRSSKPEYIAVSLEEPANVICDVDANPDNFHYSWSFRNSSSREETPIAFEEPSNLLIYTPLSEHDFGSLLCTATNDVGSQRLPCVYTLVLAGKPESVKNCSVLNENEDAFGVVCTEGFNGGLQQEFLIEVYEILSNPVLIKNFTSRVAQFSITGLEPLQTYQLRIFAVNKKGLSEPLHVQAQTLSTQPKSFLPLLENATGFKLTELIAIALGSSLALVMLSLTVLIMLSIKDRNRRLTWRSQGRLQSAAEEDPDIIPQTSDSYKPASGDNTCERK